MKTRYYINPSINIKKVNKIISIFIPIYKSSFILSQTYPMTTKNIEIIKAYNSKYAQRLLITVHSLIKDKAIETLEIKAGINFVDSVFRGLINPSPLFSLNLCIIFSI